MKGALATAIFAAFGASLGHAGGNGRGQTPPMGWRSWNYYGGNIDQGKMMAQMSAMAARTRLVDGVPTSLADLGYNDAGLDDNWQECGSYGPNAYTYHEPTGNPVVNTARFWNMTNMTAYAHSLGLTAGFYGNNCICRDHCSDPSCYEGDVNATIAFGFDSIKLDNCGAETDLDLWWNLFAAAGKNMLVENCHWGLTLPNATWCPFSYYRSSGDINAHYASIVTNLNSVPPLAAKNLSTPQCWAYPDMLEVGVGGTDAPGGIPDLSYTEWRSHFAAWCIVSSPLILGLDMTNATLMDQVWPIVANTEAIAVNQAYHGFSGSVYAQANTTVNLCTGGCTFPTWQALYKPVSATATAVLVMNHDAVAHDLTIDFASVPGLPCGTSSATGPCLVRDINARADRGSANGQYTVPAVASHDSVFVMLSKA